MSVADLIDPIGNSDGAVTLLNAENWMQGRTLYGGASALLAYTHAIRKFTDLPPLRAAQIGFVAPVGADFELRSEIVRQGRNVTQLRSEVISDGKIALTAVWVFGTSRDPNAVYPSAPIGEGPGLPGASPAVDSRHPPSFVSNNFDVHYTADRQDAGKPVIRRWVRLKEPSNTDPISELVLMGDTLPPSAMRVMQRRGPLSSINWSFNVLDTEPVTRDGWWLVETASDHADQGYSSERLRLWNADGKQMLSGIQAVAIFG
ncbi:acyl-CoA thioesterase [Pontixanthobacter aquaemixtae]|uniref:Thioesterase family protein n=1 Tax=Pontixanthobacter aquaemixtae TaxID=1958940 RepID=A0A844ZWK5_9SPHN|nr:thioesterase family protein [Pontixanthobacter aquaemixtae]MXO91834.1 thioesterase family protein [Pontixanthobacter aquaemixtae]